MATQRTFEAPNIDECDAYTTYQRLLAEVDVLEQQRTEVIWERASLPQDATEAAYGTLSGKIQRLDGAIAGKCQDSEWGVASSGSIG